MTKVDQFNKILFSWFAKNQRDLPWRNTHNPYRILVSEMMLQQTQVERVLPKYKEFVRVFPSAKKLAASSLGDVLRVWSGLGYNRRAKYLWESARRVNDIYKGRIPKDFIELQKFPGIGRSTASALCAFAYLQDEPMIDTNIRRVITRVFFDGQVKKDRELYDFTKWLIPKGRGRDWNWAVMDVGAIHCKAIGHLGSCPLSELHGRVGDFQYKKPQSRFAGSRRYYRGRIVAMLVEQKGSVCVAKLASVLNIDRVYTRSIIDDLLQEKFIILNGSSVKIRQ